MIKILIPFLIEKILTPGLNNSISIVTSLITFLVHVYILDFTISQSCIILFIHGYINFRLFKSLTHIINLLISFEVHLFYFFIRRDKTDPCRLVNVRVTGLIGLFFLAHLCLFINFHSSRR